VAAFVAFYVLPLNAETPADGSPEKEARTAAAEYEKSQGLRLRQDFWDGSLSGTKGKAIRLQFFKGHTYRLFLATTALENTKGTRLHLMVVDKNGNVLGESKISGPVTTIEVKPRKTGAYMVLMRAELAKGSKERAIPAVMFYGYR
jgi:hypothetical protein